MKKLTCLLVVVFCLSLQMMAQVKKTTAKPATPAMPDIEKMLKDLPADERAMVKEMMGNKTSAVVNKVEPVKKAASPIIKIPLKQPLQVPTQAQAKDHLLWYKGKKINDSMLVTTKAMLVLYSNKRNMVVAEPLEKTDSFRLMVKNVSKEAKMTEDYIEGEAAKKNSFLNYPLIQMTVDRFEVIDELFNNAIKNTIDLPEVNLSKPVPGKSKGAGMDEEFTPEQSIAEMYKKLKNLLANEPDKNFDAPPKDQFGVSYHCDKNALQLYREAENNWSLKFKEYEVDLFRCAMGIARALQLSGYEESDIDAAFPGLNADIQKAQDRYFSRLDEKLSKLISSYGKNIFMQPCIIRTALGIERQRQLMSLPEGTGLAAIHLMEGPEFENYINEQIDKKNWDVILDIPYMLGRNRSAQLLGQEDLSERLSKLTFKLLDLNRFALTIDIDFNERYHTSDGEDALKVNGSIKTIDKVYVSLFPGTCPRWILMLPSFDYEMKKLPYIPLQVVSGLKSIKVDKNWVNYSYSGPKDMIMNAPAFAIDFTRTNEPDTAVLQTLRYEDGEPYIWKDYATAYTTDLTGYLNDVYVRPELTAANEQKVKDYGKAMMAKFSGIIPIQNNTTTLEKLKSQHSITMLKQEGARSISEIMNTAIPAFLFNAQNGSSTLIDINVDTKHKNDYVEVVYGILKLKVVHDPITD